jgi:hypothetical protein
VTGTRASRGALVLWSAPRCRSTVFLRMMAERGDVAIVHEPLSRVHDFGSGQVLDRTCTSGPEVIDAVLAAGTTARVFVKDTTDFDYPEVLSNPEFLAGAQHTFIIRHPRAAIASHAALNPDLTVDEIGFARLRGIHDAVEAATGIPPVVVDSDDLVRDPAATVRAYCAAVGLEYLERALRWSPGALPLWQATARWHADVAASDGIRAEGTRTPAVDVDADPVLRGYLRFHEPHYEWLLERALPVE